MKNGPVSLNLSSIRNNKPTHLFNIEFHEKAVRHEESVTSLVETTRKCIQKSTQKNIQEIMEKQRLGEMLGERLNMIVPV